MDLGCLRNVHAIVLQCGDLFRFHSGWVTKMRMSLSVVEEPGEGDWTEVGEEPKCKRENPYE